MLSANADDLILHDKLDIWIWFSLEHPKKELASIRSKFFGKYTHESSIHPAKAEGRIRYTVLENFM